MSIKNISKKGFTLVELLAVIVILGLLSIIAIPAIDKAIQNSKNELYNVQVKNIVNGAKNWATKNFILLPDEESESITITIGQLKIGSFLVEDIKNPKNNKQFPNDMEIVITRRGNNYIYELLEDTGSEGGGNTSDSPLIILNGLPHEIIEIHTPYQDKGIIAKDPTGAIMENYTTVIKSNNTVVPSIDSTRLGQYKITYTAEYNGKTASSIRTVSIKDTIAPLLTIPGNIELNPSQVGDFNAIEGVSATDNSLKEPTIKVSGNLSALLGDYILVYTATDENGNTTTKSRKITVKQEFMTDSRDGKKYPIVQIGNQVWMAENLKYVGNGCLSKTWNSSSSGPIDACLANGEEIHYQWKAAMNGSTAEGVQGICPTGWHIPTDAEWKVLEGTVDTTYKVGNAEWDKSGAWRGSDAGKKLKGTAGGGTNDFGFNGLLVGYRYPDGTIYNVGAHSDWWSSSPSGTDAWYRYVNSSNDTVLRVTGTQAHGFSVRCVRD